MGNLGCLSLGPMALVHMSNVSSETNIKTNMVDVLCNISHVNVNWKLTLFGWGLGGYTGKILPPWGALRVWASCLAVGSGGCPRVNVHTSVLIY